MNPKILLAFGAGALLASGIVYMAVRPRPEAHSAALAPAVASQPAPQTEQLADVGVTPAPRLRSPRKAAALPAAIQAEAPKPDPVKQDVQQAQAVVEPPPPAAPASPTLPPPPPELPHSVTLPAGATLEVRIGETLSTKKNQAGDTFTATLVQPLLVDGFVIAEKGARAAGRIVEADRAGKVKGVSHLTVELNKITTSDGQSVPVRTVSYSKEGNTERKKDAAKVGIGAALGAAIGAIAGGGKGAGIGAGVGGAAGAGDVLLTRGPEAEIPVETRLTFKIQEPVTITEKLH